MKRWIHASGNRGQAVGEYKDVTIYKDERNRFYIYEGPKGTDKVEFPSEKEAEEYIDESL